jgi:chromosome segregation ATPase
MNDEEMDTLKQDLINSTLKTVDDFKALIDEVKALRKQLADKEAIKAELDHTKHELEVANRVVASLDDVVEEYRNYITTLQISNREKQDRIAELELMGYDFAGKMELEQKVLELELENRRLEHEADKDTETLDQAGDLLQDRGDEIELLENEVVGLNTEIDRLCKLRDQQVCELNEEIKQWKQHNQTLYEQLQSGKHNTHSFNSGMEQAAKLVEQDDLELAAKIRAAKDM